MTDLERVPILRVMPGPGDINANGHIFGGWVLSQMDIAAGIVASRRAKGPVATVAIEAMEFIAPIHLRDLISVYAQVERVGRTSMGVRIEVIAHRDLGATEVKVTEGLFTFVALDANHRPRAITLAVAAVRAVTALGTLLGSLLFAGLDKLLLALVLIEPVTALAALVLEACAALAQHAEIVIRILQVIFGLDPVAGELGVTRHALVFFEQLGGIAALTIVLPVPRLSAEILAPLSPAATPAAALSIVDQMPTSLRS